MLTYFFPGQGSQKKGMGEGLFEAFPEETAKADEVLGYSIRQLCLEDPDNQLNLTQFTQPALYVVNALTYLKRLQESEARPDYFAGHSLGEYNALFAAGAFDFETGLRLVQKRGALMGEAEGGGMAAVIGLEEARVREIVSGWEKDTIDFANFNSPFQIVLSGPTEDILALKPIFTEAGVRMYMPLKVSAAFHSRYMQPASDAFAEFLKGFQFKALQTPVISNVEARPYKNDQIADMLAAQIVSSVRWTESIRYLMGKGVTEFEEIGPGKVLAGLYKKISKEAEPLIVDDAPVESAGQDSPGPARTSLPEPKPPGPSRNLGSAAFREAYGLNYAYMAGGMYKGISSVDMVLRLANAGCLGSFGSGGLDLGETERAIGRLQREMPNGVGFAVNLVNDAEGEKSLEALVNLCLRKGVDVIEAANFIQMAPALVRYRLKGCRRDENGRVVAGNRIIAKATRPEVAKAFLSPPPPRVVQKLVTAGQLEASEAEFATSVPMADDIIAQADGGWHTDMGLAFALLPALRSLRDEMMEKHKYGQTVRIGAAGGIGTPAAAAAAFVLGADFIVTGSINQATPEAATSTAVKDLLQQMNVQDTEYAPSGDLFELGARVQVLKRGLFFPARANKLFDLYRRYGGLGEIDGKTSKQVQDRFFKRGFDEIWRDIQQTKAGSRMVENAERNPKAKMALVFKWYFDHAMDLALRGSDAQKVDYQIFCGQALGAFNQWVQGTAFDQWQQRHVDAIAVHLLDETEALLRRRFSELGYGND